jgi:hypothetical protein
MLSIAGVHPSEVTTIFTKRVTVSPGPTRHKNCDADNSGGLVHSVGRDGLWCRSRKIKRRSRLSGTIGSCRVVSVRLVGFSEFLEDSLDGP